MGHASSMATEAYKAYDEYRTARNNAIQAITYAEGLIDRQDGIEDLTPWKIERTLEALEWRLRDILNQPKPEVTR